MAQRITQQREIYVRTESSEGADPGSWVGGDAILVSNLTLGADRQYLERNFSGVFGSRKGQIGIQADPTLSFTCELRGGNTAKTPEIDLLWKSVLGGTPVDDAGASTVSSAADAKTITLVDASGYSVGSAVAVETATAGKYEIGWIESKASNTITLTHNLSFTPTNGKNVKPSITYKLGDSSHPSLAFRVWLDSSNYLMFLGCKGSVKLDAAAPGAIATATFSFKAMSWEHGAASRPVASYDPTVAPTLTKFKIDAAFPDIKTASWDLSQNVAKKMSQNATNGTVGHVVTNRDLKGSLQLYDVDETQFTGWAAGTEVALAQQFGDAQYNTIAYYIPKAQRAKVGYGDDNGLTTDMIDFQGNNASDAGKDEVKVAYV